MTAASAVRSDPAPPGVPPPSGGRRFALIAGGGTAGHLLPALAIGEALVAAGHDRDTIEFVGSARGRDGTVLGGRGFPVTLLPGRGIVRSLRPRALVDNLGALGGLLEAAVRAARVVATRRPRVVVSVGGYASLAASLWAVVLRVPLVLVNIDAVPGAANRLFGRFASAAAVGWPGTPLPRAEVVGTPVRDEIARVRRDPASRAVARGELGLPADRLVVAAFGGSLGARRINEAVAELARRWVDRSDVAVYHVVGHRDWETFRGVGGGPGDGDVDGDVPRGGRSPASGLVRSTIAYEDRMELVYAAADVVVCRAGAMTVAELALAGVPAVLVPLPGAPGDHQTANARVLERDGAAVLLADDRCDGSTLADVVGELLAAPDRLAAMAAAALALGRPDAARDGARVVEAHARPAPNPPSASSGSGGTP